MNLSEIFLSDGTLSPTLMLWLFYIAAVIGTVIYFTVNYQLGKIVTKLLELEATTPETAVSVEEAELKTGFFTKICLRSTMNYKNLLVAITADGKFYANMRYTDEPPTFKLLRAITRKRKSRIKDKKSKDTANDADTNTSVDPAETTEATDSVEPIINEAAENNVVVTNPEAESNISEDGEPELIPDDLQQTGTSRVTFNPFTAKYYIPREVHDKAKGIYKTSKTNVLLIIAALVGLGVLIYFAGFLLDGMIDSFKSIGK